MGSHVFDLWLWIKNKDKTQKVQVTTITCGRLASPEMDMQEHFEVC